MNSDLSRLQWIPIAVGMAVWFIALVAIWARPEQDISAQRDQDFEAWKSTTGQPAATFAEFLASEQAPRTYLSRASLSAVVTALGLLLLVSALRDWAVAQ